MKSKLIALIMVCSATTSVAEANKSCDVYMQAASGNASSHVRLELGLKALVEAADVVLRPAQQANILARVEGFIAKHPKKQDDFEKLIYFACTTDLDESEKEQIKDQICAFQLL